MGSGVARPTPSGEGARWSRSGTGVASIVVSRSGVVGCANFVHCQWRSRHFLRGPTVSTSSAFASTASGVTDLRLFEAWMGGDVDLKYPT